MTRIPCPYCSQIVDAGAVACSTCGGLLAIGSHLAIRQALAADPTLSLKDQDSVARLKEFVARIDGSIAQSEQLNQDEANRLRQEAESKDRILREQEVAAKAAKDKARQEYLESISPQKRFLIVRKIPIAVSLALLAIAAVVIPSQLSVVRENQRAEQEKANQEQMAAQELDALIATADQQVLDLESKYCVVLNSIIGDKELEIILTQSASDYTAIDSAMDDFQNETIEIYNSYMGLMLNLGSEASKFSSPVMDRHVTTWDSDSWFLKGNKETWIQAYSLCR